LFDLEAEEELQLTHHAHLKFPAHFDNLPRKMSYYRLNQSTLVIKQ
jgi:hypothetical protein